MAVLRDMKHVKEETYGKEVFLRKVPDPLLAFSMENNTSQQPCLVRSAVRIRSGMD